MKVRDTSRGRMYALSSEIGCTAINGAMAVDIPAGGQSVILALDKKLIIDGDDDAKFVEVRWGTNAAVGSRPAPSWIGDVVDGLVSIVGADKFDISYVPAENKVYLVFSLDTTVSQITEVENLLDRVLPSNVTTEMEWENGLPIDYTPIEWLGGIGGDRNFPYIATMFYPTDKTSVRIDAEPTSKSSDGWPAPSGSVFYAFGSALGGRYGDFQMVGLLLHAGGYAHPIWNNAYRAMGTLPGRQVWELKNAQFIVSGKVFHTFETAEFVSTFPLVCMSEYPTGRGFRGKVWSFKVWEDETPVLNYIPALDPTGAPCMFDTVTREAFYSSGTGDFLYPGKETEATTYSLRNRMYAQYTEHGIRRLYRVPAGYEGSKEEYAAEHGFKLLVETPMPEEGYWTPVWHDREDCIELEWVETEPPTEEELQIEEIENA